uniref:exocyst complex component 1 isoform X1 n=2 Tax=Myxine glutinosa TaxID=7769 RepID=UPI00358DE69F
MFIHQGNSVGSGGSAGELSLPKHHQHHRDLLPYADLLGWLKTTDSSIYSELAKVYAQMLSKLYEKEIRNFLDAAKQRILTSSKEGRRLAVQVGAGRYTGSSSSLNKLGANTLAGLPSTPGHPRTLATSPPSDVGIMSAPDQDVTERSAFDKVFEQVLAELEPMCLAEQDFLCKFFNLQVLTNDAPHSVESELDGAIQSRPHSLLTGQDFPRVDAEILQRLMAEVFGAVEMELASLITTGDRLDGLNSLYMLVNMSHHVLTAQKADSTSFLSTTLGNVLVLIKRNFDRHIAGMERQMDEAKVPKKGKAGILSFVTAFEEFAGLAEAIFRNASRRGELDKAYSKLIAAIFVSLEKAALESLKTPRDVVLMENYHHLFATLSRLKIGCLENERRDAKREYTEHLHAYVISSLGQPLPKLNEFFEGVEVRVAQGVKEDEVGYQLAFSKQELRKVLREYPGKEVKKGLENLYRKVEKHFCEEENLLQVVWRSLQEVFIRQYKHFEELIARCYPGSGICDVEFVRLFPHSVKKARFEETPNDGWLKIIRMRVGAQNKLPVAMDLYQQHTECSMSEL